MTYFSYNIQFMYEYYAIEKQEIFCMLSMLPLHLADRRPSFLQLFENLFSPQSVQPLFKFLNKYFCSITFITYKFSIKIRSSSLEPMFTPNH